MANVQSLLAKLRRPSTAADSDRMLLARFASQNDGDAFAALVERHGPLVLGVCRRTIRDAHLAEDAFQAVFLVLAKTAHRVSVRESLANWLYVVARRIAVKAARRRATDPTGEPVERTVEPHVGERNELVRVLDEELERLPAKYRQPLIAFHLQDRTQDETAALLGWSLSTVRRRLDAGRELLRRRLSARGATLGVIAATTVPSAMAAETVELAVAVRSGVSVNPRLQPLLNEGLRMGVNYWKLGGVLAVTMVAIGVAASNGDEKPIPEKARQLIAAPAVVAKWSTVKGRVVWPTGSPNLAPVIVSADKEHCLSKGAIESDEVLVNKKNGGLKNVWVYLRPDDDKLVPFKPAEIHPDLQKPKAKEHEVDQPCCQFIPRVLAVRVGDTIQFKNSSPIPHNVKYEGNTATPEFNVLLASGQTHTTPAMKPDIRPNSFGCNVHPWMRGSLMVFDHPYYALTDADGNFEIKNAPVGKYRIMYRHERGYHKGRDGGKGFPLTIAGPTTELDPLKYEEPPTK